MKQPGSPTLFTSKHRYEIAWGIILFGGWAGENRIFLAILPQCLLVNTTIAHQNFLLSVKSDSRTISGVGCDLSLREQQLFCR